MTTMSVRPASPSSRRCKLASAHLLTASAPRLTEVPIDGQINAPALLHVTSFQPRPTYAHIRAVCMHKSEHCREVRNAR